PQRHERIERGYREHAERADIQPAILLELPEVEHVVADRNADSRGETVRGEYAIRQILDRKVRCRIDRNEGAQRGVVGVGHYFVLMACSGRNAFPDPSSNPRSRPAASTTSPHARSRAAETVSRT